MDFVARAADLHRTALLVVSGADDFPGCRGGARRGTDDGAGLAHPLADRPGERPAPQTPQARIVDDAVTAWFAAHLAA